tara:strand:- start:745 stop:1191 length:447 start_codon:yes stop_codon:yes gene_type:complete
MIESKIKEFLNSWTKGVIEIGKAFSKKENFKKEALKFLSKHYAFKTQKILFKPTYTKEKIFRNNLEDALSYFVKGKFSEDNGFALKPWEEIILKELNILNEKNLSAAMGMLSFKPVSSNEMTLVAFTFIFCLEDGEIKIKVHHSSPVL